jgi:hypothetical protein
MGFGHKETLEALEHAGTHVGQAGTLEELLRYALKVLTGEVASAS